MQPFPLDQELSDSHHDQSRSLVFFENLFRIFFGIQSLELNELQQSCPYPGILLLKATGYKPYLPDGFQLILLYLENPENIDESVRSILSHLEVPGLKQRILILSEKENSVCFAETPDLRFVDASRFVSLASVYDYPGFEEQLLSVLLNSQKVQQVLEETGIEDPFQQRSLAMAYLCVLLLAFVQDMRLERAMELLYAGNPQILKALRLFFKEEGRLYPYLQEHPDQALLIALLATERKKAMDTIRHCLYTLHETFASRQVQAIVYELLENFQMDPFDQDQLLRLYQCIYLVANAIELLPEKTLHAFQQFRQAQQLLSHMLYQNRHPELYRIYARLVSAFVPAFLAQKKYFPLANTAMERALEIFSGNQPEDRERVLSLLHFANGTLYLKQEQKEAARENLAKAAQLASSFHQHQTGLGSFIWLSQLRDGLAALQKEEPESLDPEFWLYLNALLIV